MPLDPETLKARWGITGTGQDALVAEVAAQAQAICETYTARRFDLETDSGDFEPVGLSFQVPRWPIVQVTALHGWLAGQLPGAPTPGPPIAGFQMDKARGLVWPGGGNFFAGAPWRMVHCEWSGGLDPWPPDLTYAVTQAADIIWSDTPGGGAPAGSAGGASVGAIKKISVVGVYSAELADGGDGGDADGNNVWGVLPPPVTAILDRYRPAALIGIG